MINIFLNCVGYGGGYNERGTVEYKERVPSDDDEYDQVMHQVMC
jgi:hypothetical protein